MQKKCFLSIILGIILVAALILGGLFYFSNESEWFDLSVSEYTISNPPPKDQIYLLTDTDFLEYPELRLVLEEETSTPIPISSNPFVVLKHQNPPCISKETADEIISRYAWMTERKHLLYNDTCLI